MPYTIPKRLQPLADSMIRTMTIEASRHGAINMGQGMPEFEPHPAVIEAARASLGCALHQQYSEDRGAPELREAIAAKYARCYNLLADPETEVTVVCGVTEAIVAAILATVDAGDRVVLIEPAHENYFAATLFAGGAPVWIPLEAPAFALDLDRIEAAFQRGARALILNTPHNPTGRVFTEAELSGLAALCVKHDVIVLTDEIYEHITYDDHAHRPLALLPGMRERTITASGVGKSYSLTGWRIGYLVAPPAITEMIRRVHTFVSICAPTPLQHAAIAALALPDSYYEELQGIYTASRNRMMEILERTGFRARPPEGAYYVMADFSELSCEDDVAFCMRLVRERKVSVVPGGSFYANPAFGWKLVRFAFPKPLSMLDEVGRRLAALSRA